MDAVGGIIIAGYIFYMARMAFKESTLVLLDAVKNPELEDDISNHIEQNFNVDVEDVLIRPLGHAMSAQIHVNMNPSLTLKEVHDITTKIRDSVMEKFGTEETTVVPKPT
jgi:divalent metal cation (Fe/Co/Zn/Cd) transporter